MYNNRLPASFFQNFERETVNQVSLALGVKSVLTTKLRDGEYESYLAIL